MGILSRIGFKKVQQAGAAITSAIIRLDPATATEAQIDELDAQFRGLSIQLAESEQELKREQQEAEAAQAGYDKRKKAVAKLLENAEAATDPTQKANLEKSAGKLIGELERTKPDVEREKQEAEDARALRDQLRETTEAMAENLKQVRSALEQAQRRMQTAAAREAAAEKSAEVAAQLAGIKQAGSKFNTVLDTLNETAAKHEAKAAAAATRASLIKPASEGDENIEAALREVSGEPPKADLKSRLANL